MQYRKGMSSMMEFHVFHYLDQRLSRLFKFKVICCILTNMSNIRYLEDIIIYLNNGLHNFGM